MRVKWMIGLTQRSISSTASGIRSGWSRSCSHSPRCSENASSPPLIAFRVVSLPASTISSQYDEQLHLGERLAVDLRVEQVADEVVARFAPALLDELAQVGVHLAARAPDGLARRLARTAELGIVLADHLVGPLEQQLPVGTGTPRSQEITAIGSGAAMRSTKSNSLGAVGGRHLVERSRPRCARSRSWRDRIARGVKRRHRDPRGGVRAAADRA